MTYNDFKNKYNGKIVDYDGAYGGQCWDLAQQYFTECLGLSPSILGGCGLVSNMLNEPKISLLLKYFDEVPTTNMLAGDVVIWTGGHIAIFDNWDGVNCNYLTQNPGATRVGVCYVKGTMRAFRKKSTSPAPAPKPTPSNKRYLNLKPTVDSWKVYKTHNYFNPNNKEDILAILNPKKFGGLSYEILKDYGDYHFKIQTQQFGIGYISGNIEKYPCTITNHPEY